MKIKLTALLLLIGCSGKQKHDNKDVIELREKLPKIETPIKFNSDIRVKYKTVELEDNELIKKLAARNPFSLFGKVFETENNITILGYTFDKIGTPVIITFGNDGNEISSHIIFENVMSDVGLHTSNIVTIRPDRQILFTDSTVTSMLVGEGINSTARDSVLVKHKKYLISENGSIEKLN
jgi:hypothetical protein